MANSKTLHHLLPQLIPPMDREYTLNFFFAGTNLRHDGGKSQFSQIFQKCHAIAATKKVVIRGRVRTNMSTSESKVVDEAIIGYGLKYKTNP